jgi:hypothetical protein
MKRRFREARARDEALLVSLAERLCAVAAEIEPTAEFRTSARTALLTDVTVATDPPHRQQAARRRRRIAVATGFVICVLGGGGLAQASTSAVPGEALYPVKRMVERLELSTKRDDEARGGFRLELATERLAEATQLAGRPGPASRSLGNTAVTEFTEQAEAGSNDLVAAFRRTNSRSSLALLNRFSAAAVRALESLQARFDDEALLIATRQRLNAIVGRSLSLCPGCDGTDRLLANSTGRTPSPTPHNKASDSPTTGPSSPTKAPDQRTPRAGTPTVGTPIDELDDAIGGITGGDDAAQRADPPASASPPSLSDLLDPARPVLPDAPLPGQ